MFTCLHLDYGVRTSSTSHCCKFRIFLQIITIYFFRNFPAISDILESKIFPLQPLSGSPICWIHQLCCWLKGSPGSSVARYCCCCTSTRFNPLLEALTFSRSFWSAPSVSRLEFGPVQIFLGFLQMQNQLKATRLTRFDGHLSSRTFSFSMIFTAVSCLHWNSNCSTWRSSSWSLRATALSWAQLLLLLDCISSSV